jgi:hypothetical protein
MAHTAKGDNPDDNKRTDSGNDQTNDKPEPEGDNKEEQVKPNVNNDDDNTGDYGAKEGDAKDSSSSIGDSVTGVGSGEQTGVEDVKEESDSTDTVEEGKEVEDRPIGRSRSQRTKVKHEQIQPQASKKTRFDLNDQVMSAKPSRSPTKHKPWSRPLNRRKSQMSKAKVEKREPDLPLKVAQPLQQPTPAKIPAMASLAPEPAEVEGVVLTLFPANTHRDPIKHDYKASATVVRKHRLYFIFTFHHIVNDSVVLMLTGKH